MQENFREQGGGEGDGSGINGNIKEKGREGAANIESNDAKGPNQMRCGIISLGVVNGT